MFHCDSPFRHDFNEILTAMLYEDRSSDSSSSDDDDDDLDLLLVDTIFPSTVKLDFPRLNLVDLSDLQCEAMFRHVLGFCEKLFRCFTYGHEGPESIVMILYKNRG